ACSRSSRACATSSASIATGGSPAHSARRSPLERCGTQLTSVPRYGSRVSGVRVGEVAERAGVNVETLRYYERRGLLPTPDRTPTSRPQLLHITNGESAGNTLRQTTLGGAVLPWQDTLHEGPVPALPRRELLRTRARFLADCGWGRQQALLSSFERRDRQLLEALRADLQVVLWFEHDLYDQLQLLDVLALAHTEETAPELIVVGSFPGKPSFAGIGELTASELETLWPSRGRATSAALEAATSAWAALREPEPAALAEWATRDIAELPFLASALRRLL